MTTARPLDSEELANTTPERELLEAFIDAYRDVSRVKHAAAVERNWFQHCMEQQQREQITGNSFGDDASWQVGSDEPVADIAAYAAVCDRSRQIAAGLALDDTVAHPRLGRVSLRAHDP